MSSSRVFEQVQLAEAVYSNFILVNGVPIEGVPTDQQVSRPLKNAS